MIFSRFLLGLLAVNLAAATLVDFDEKTDKQPKKVSVAAFHHESEGHPDVAESRKIRTKKKGWEVEGITSEGLELLWKPSKWLCLWGLAPNSAYFLANFQLPLGNVDFKPDDFVKVFLIFTYKSGLDFEWNPEVTESNQHFQHEKSLRVNEDTSREIYRLSGRPASVIPIRLMVLDVQKGITFTTEWAETLDEDYRMPLNLQLVTLKPARTSFLTAMEYKLLPPKGEPVANASIRQTLYSSLRTSDLEDIASHIDIHSRFDLRSYFKSTPGPKRYVLSSEEPVEARIYTNPGDYGRFYTLDAYKGRATELVVDWDPNVLHNIEIKGKLSSYLDCGFTLQVYEADDEFQSSNVDLMTPYGREGESTAHRIGWYDDDPE